MKIKTFRGRLGDGDQERIRLSTKQGLIGYSIRKFQIIDQEPGTTNTELVAKLYSVKQSTIDGLVNFEDPLLLGVAYYTESSNTAYPGFQSVIFDHVKINQDIFITGIDVSASNSINYYIELEQVTLSTDEAAVATLKDMRGRE